MIRVFGGLTPAADENIIMMAVCLIVAYLSGSISPAILISKAAGVDIKSEGSGNAGTTNMLRIMGKRAAVITLVIDIIKGAAAVLIVRYVSCEFAAMLSVIAVLAGHIWPVFHKFRGGKGVATLFGALLAFKWAIALAALGVVAAGVMITRRMSAGSLLGVLLLPLITYFLEPGFLIPTVAVSLLLIYKHCSNIVRLCRGEEPKLGEKKH